MVHFSHSLSCVIGNWFVFLACIQQLGDISFLVGTAPNAFGKHKLLQQTTRTKQYEPVHFFSEKSNENRKCKHNTEWVSLVLILLLTNFHSYKKNLPYQKFKNNTTMRIHWANEVNSSIYAWAIDKVMVDFLSVALIRAADFEFESNGL